jgi:hypothetical protein
MRFVQVAHFIQFFELGGQVGCEGHNPRVISFDVFSLEANQSRFEI